MCPDCTPPNADPCPPCPDTRGRAHRLLHYCGSDFGNTQGPSGLETQTLPEVTANGYRQELPRKQVAASPRPELGILQIDFPQETAHPCQIPATYPSFIDPVPDG